MHIYRHHFIISFCIIFFGILNINFCTAQGITQNIHYELESGVFLSTSGKTPFWLRSNQYGLVPLNSQFITLRGAAHKEYDTTYNKHKQQQKFGYGYGINALINAGNANQLLLPEAYMKVRYGAFELYGGRRKEIFGLVDTSLSAGSFIWSGNALPMPKIQISVPNYTSIIGHGLVAIKGSYAHGWFGSIDSTKNFFLHQKTLYGRIGKPNWRIKLYAGFNHQVQWGGRPHKPYIEKQTGKLITSYGNDFNTYLNVITGISLNKNGDGATKDGIPINDAWNRAGNHLGSVDIAAEVNFNNFDVLLYRQSFYEDGSLFYLNNITDGLFGMAFSRKNTHHGLLKLTFEYLNTSNQGGDGNSGNTIPELRGNDNYFNNSFYSWAYRTNTIGTAFITPLGLIRKEAFNTYKSIDKIIPQTYMVNNRVRSIYLGAKYAIYNKLLLTKVALSQNTVYGINEKQSQLSILQSAQFGYKVYRIKLQLSYDSNALFKQSLGTSLHISRGF